jgi:hypothetical protein
MARFLCVCRRGNVRSVAVATFLKEVHNHEAVAIGFETAGPELVDVLGRWADRILVARSEFAAHVPDRFVPKIAILDIGPDVFGSPTHPELMRIVAFQMEEFLARPDCRAAV